MSRRFRDMQTPEQQYVQRQAGAAAERSRQAAGKHAADATDWGNQAAIYGRDGKSYADPARAADASRQSNHHARQAARHSAEAEQHESIATQAAPKRRWWQ